MQNTGSQNGEPRTANGERCRLKLRTNSDPPFSSAALLLGQEFNSFRRKTRSNVLHEFKLHRQEKFLYVCDTLDMWEWDVRVLDIQDGVEGDHAPV